MRKTKKKRAREYVRLLDKAHEAVRKAIETRNTGIAMELLEECQDAAIQLGGLIEESEGENFSTISILEDYCELVYQIHEAVREDAKADAGRFYKRLHKFSIQIENSINNEIATQTEAVFLPYKASMWDSLESVWKAADEDPDCSAYVIPIPYYDKNPDGSFGEAHYEGDQYPAYVPVTDYNSYDFEERRPDIIFIHNPYDQYNRVTSVHPFFYTSNLKKFTDKLVYIPYYILDEIDPDNHEAVDGVKHFCTVPGVVNADKVIVQSEGWRQIYINVMTAEMGEETRSIWKEKILGLGSPKVDKVLGTRIEDIEIPEEWRKIIDKPDGSRRKIIFYNTCVTALLQHGEKMLRKMEQVFATFKENQEEVALLWRPHPLVQATIESMRPQLWEEYRKLMEKYREEGWGIYDDTPDMNRAIVLSDGYYGDASSIVQLYEKTGKPIMMQDVEVLKSARYEYDIASAEAICNYRGSYYFVFMYEPLLCKMNQETLECELLYRFYEGESVGRLYRKIVPYKSRLFLVPFFSDHIAIYDIGTEKLKFIRLNENYVDVRWQENLVSAKFIDVIVKDRFLYMIPYTYHAIIKIDMEYLTLEEIPLGRKGTDIFYYCMGSACQQGNKIVFPIYSEGSVCVLNMDTQESDRVFPTGREKKYSNIFGIGNRIWLIPEKLYEGIDIWNITSKEVEKTLALTDEINIQSHKKETMDIRIGFLFDSKLHLLPFGLDYGVVVDVASEKASIWNLPNEYSKEEFPTDQQYLFGLRYNSVLFEDKRVLICGFRGEWLECKADKVCVIERRSVRDKRLTAALSIKKLNKVIAEGNLDLEDFIKIERENLNTDTGDDIGKNVYEYMSGQD